MSRAEMDRAPEISIRRFDGGLELESTVPLGHLADLRDARHLRVAMAAVIEDDGGGLSYWGAAARARQTRFPPPERICTGGCSLMKFGIDRLLEEPELRKPLAGLRCSPLGAPRLGNTRPEPFARRAGGRRRC